MLLKQVKSYIDNNLNPANINGIDLTKVNFCQPLFVKEILYELGFSNNGYYILQSFINMKR